MQSLKAKQVAKYVLMPGFIPRLQGLFGSGFGYIAFLMANIYGMVRLLPANHPYLVPGNIGRYGIRHVIAEAANNLVISKKNIDQILIFMALLTGIVILGLQIIVLIYAALIQPALAFSGPGPGGFSIFATENPERDVAFIMLDKVFGIPGFFNSCVDQGIACADDALAEPGNLPHPFHVGFHELLRFYSLGLLIIGVFIFLYFVVAVVLETATTGSPFGQRFQNIWVPVRLVVALGLLVPLNYGLNSGQYITLFAAKAGSGFATNAWLRFNNIIDSATPGTSTPTGEGEAMIALPNQPDISPVVAFMSLVHGCAYAHWHMDRRQDIRKPMAPDGRFYIKPYLVKNDFFGSGGQKRKEVTSNLSYQDAVNFYDKGDIVIRFGRLDENKYKQQKGNVQPTCGEIRVKINSVKHLENPIGPDEIQRRYYETIKDLWFSEDEGPLGQISRRYLALAMPDIFIAEDGNRPIECSTFNGFNKKLGCGQGGFPPCGDQGDACDHNVPISELKQQIINFYQGNINSRIRDVWNTYNQDGRDIEMTEQIRERGWGGAGIWYNTVSQTNGLFTQSVFEVPTVTSMPYIMEAVRLTNLAHDESVEADQQFEPFLSGSFATDSSISGGSDAVNIAKGLNDLYTYWIIGGMNHAFSDKTATGNAFEDTMNMLFGTNGIIAMRTYNAHIHPLAQLSAAGKGLVESAIINVTGGSAFTVMGGLFSSLSGGPSGKISELIGSFATSTAFVGLTAGLVLYYILPFLPFVYFFFAVGSWVKAIFEAMVGVPLWALSHLRLDGEGLPGDSAQAGYFLILEIFLRPILTVFGLIASMVIFTAQVRILNFTWTLVVDNLSGFAGDNIDTNMTVFAGQVQISRGIVDQFFFTVIYVMICYMMATASFKLIDRIPDDILRWKNAGVSSFGDIDQDVVQGLTRYAALGGMTIGQDAVRAFNDLSKGGAQSIGGELAKMRNLLGGGGGVGTGGGAGGR